MSTAPNLVASLAQTPITDPKTGLVSWPWLRYFQSGNLFSANQPQFLSGTHEDRLVNSPPQNYPVGSTFYETDRTVTYLQIGGVWVYVTGIMATPQSGLPGDLGSHDAGFLADVTDFLHTLRWNGTSWAFADGGSGQVAQFLADPGTGWHICDGSNVNRLNADGSISSVTLPDYTTAAYLKLATSAVVGPTAPSGETEAISAGTPAGTVTAPIFTGSADTTGDESADQNVQSGTGATVAAQNHTHSVTPTGTNSAPTFAGVALPTHQHGPGTIDLENTQLLAYYRM